MKRLRSAVTLAIIFLMGISLRSQAFAEEGFQTYSGNLWSRSTLTGDWGGLRDDLAKKGVTIDLNLTQITQGNISGGKEVNWQYGGRGDLTINVDTQKLGLWPGGFFTGEVEGNFGNAVNPKTGALMAVNSNQIYPTTGSDQLNIPAVTFMQFFSHYVGVAVGKVDTTSGDANEFAHGKGDTQFFNLAFNFNPVVFLTVPYSTLAGGVIILPTADPKEAIIAINALDASGVANKSDFDTLFKANMTYAIEGRVRTDFLGLTGHQLVGATYSAKNFTSIDQSLRIYLENRSIEQKDNSWCFYYNFDQYLYEPKKGSGQGVGLFGRFGASDGNPNPIHYFYSVGIGGKGVIPGRPLLDEFGIGFYYINVSNLQFTGPLQTRTGLRDEQGFEVYYNFAITPWMKFTPDVQMVKPAQQRFIDFSTPIPTVVNNNISTAIVLGLRLQMIF
jgi:porin